MKKRSEIAEEYKWDLSDYAISAEDCLQKAEAIQKSLDKFKEFENNLKDEENIFKCLELESKISKELIKIGIYADSKFNEDTSNDIYAELMSKVEAALSEASLATSFINVEIGKLSILTLKKLEQNPLHPNFSNYFKEIIRNKKYILSDKEEAILSQMGNFAGGFKANLTFYESSDIKFKPAKDSEGKNHEVTQTTYEKLLSSNDPVLRENVYKSLNGEFANLENTLANNYASHVKMISTFTKIRGYDSVLQAELYADNLSTKLYDLLIKKVKENACIFQNALNAKQQALGLEKMKISDTYADVGKEYDKEISFDNAFETIKLTLKPFGEEYIKVFDLSKAQKWIDFCENQNKRTGAYETCAYGCHPLVFMQFTNDISSTFTIAHELGHAIHSYFSNKTQPYEKSDYPIFVAEVASTVNETLLSLHLINNAQTIEEKAYYQNQFLDQARATILGQTLFAEFEKLVFEKYDLDKALSKKFFQETYENLTKEYYGNNIEILPETKYAYSRIPHFFRQFYVYKYATGMLSALLIVKKFMDKEDGIQDKYIKFLSSGSSLTPLETLKIVGVDLEKEETFDEAFEFLNWVEKDFENSVNNLKK